MKLLDHSRQLLILKTRDAFGKVRSSVLEAMQYLWQVKETEAWKEGYESFGDYVEQDLGISQGFASKLGTINKTFLIEGGLSQEKLAGIDYEKLYAAAKLGGTVEEKLAKAATLSRSELRQESSEETPHEGDFHLVCTKCWVSKQNHA